MNIWACCLYYYYNFVDLTPNLIFNFDDSVQIGLKNKVKYIWQIFFHLGGRFFFYLKDEITSLYVNNRTQWQKNYVICINAESSKCFSPEIE